MALIKKIIYPVIIYICFLALFIGISKYNDNDYLFLPIWDVEHYLSISERGYEVFPCTPGINGRAGEICGNSGWFPLWPLIVRAIRPLTGDSSPYAFIGTALLFTFLFFLLFYLFVERHYGATAAKISLLAAAFNPASFYWITGFPYALMALLFIIYVILIYSSAGYRRQFGLFFVGLALSLTYPTGFLIGLFPLVWYYYNSPRTADSFRSATYWLRWAMYVFPFILGPFLLALYFYVQFDDFLLQLHFQAKYHRTWAIPVWIMLKSIFGQPLLSPENISILWYGLIFIIFYPFRVKQEFWFLALTLFLFSLTTGSTMSIYRHYLLIIPAYLIIGFSTRPVWLRLGFIGLGLILCLNILFPLFMQYRLM